MRLSSHAVSRDEIINIEKINPTLSIHRTRQGKSSYYRKDRKEKFSNVPEQLKDTVTWV